MSEKGTYSDPRCCTCNPEGWREVDGVQLPPITWGELVPSAFPVSRTVLGDAVVDALEEHARLTAELPALEECWPGPKPYHSGRQAVLRKARAE